MPDTSLAGREKFAAYKKAMGGKKGKPKAPPKRKKAQDLGALAAYMPGRMGAMPQRRGY